MINNQFGGYGYGQQAPMMNQPRNIMSGKMVDDFNCITANDVPMDGSFAVFPKRDLSEIEVRAWSANGLINSIRFKPLDASSVKLSSESVSAENGANFEATMASIARSIEHIEQLLSPEVSESEKKVEK